MQRTFKVHLDRELNLVKYFVILVTCNLKYRCLLPNCTEILKKIDTEHYPNGHADAIKDQAKREAAMKASKVNLFPNHLAIGLSKKGNTKNFKIELKFAIPLII